VEPLSNYRKKSIGSFKAIGWEFMEPKSHDKHIAYMSHLSHIVHLC
jgi:prephenate dehydrogenase